MIRAGDLAAIVGIALVCGLVVGAIGLIALRLARRASMGVQVSIVVLTGTLSVALGMVAVAQAMFLSPHDLIVSLWVAGIAALVSLGVAAVLAVTFVRQARRVRRLAASLGGEPGDAAVVPMDASGSELAAVAGELARTSRRLEEARAEVDAMDQARREFIAWISHDLRTPLAGLRAMAEALEDGLADDPQRFHRQMRLQVDHLSDLVDDLFELSKIESGRLILAMDTVSLHDLVSDAVAELRVLADARRVTIRESPEQDALVRGDARELGRAVSNLLLNAIQYSPPGTSVAIETEIGADGRAVLSVVDQGGGIPPTDLENVFRAGWRGAESRTPAPLWGRSSGAGLGLAIARGIVVAHDGDLHARNVEGGCRFEMVLPVLPRAAA
jgi:signal transduction histidine kinase